MQTTFALAALAAVAYAVPQAGDIAPSGAAPVGCSPNYPGSFQITAVASKVMKRDIYKRTCGDPGSLVLTLIDGKLHDAQGRTGYVASNYQFQFDGPPQDGAIYTAGFSACSNGSLALGGSNVFYECLSGSFFNLYDRNWADQCEPINIDILPCGSSGDAVGQQPDGQPTGTSIETITQIPDGQPQAPTSPPITQISDGQPQAPGAPAGPAISQIPDGQPQAPAAPAGPAISQIPDGQPQAPAAPAGPAISQIPDGQPQAPATPAGPVGPAISQIPDGQPQAPAPAPAPISQIPDGQPQAPTAPARPTPISQIPDGQPQAPAPVTTGSFAPSFVTSSSPIPTLPGGSFASSIPVVASTPPAGAGGGAAAASSATTARPTLPTTNSGNAVRSSFGLGAVAVIAAVFL